MIKSYSDFDQLGHVFGNIRVSKGFAVDIEFLHCEVCDIKVWVGEEEFWVFRNFDWKMLDLTCEEVQIKRLLE